MRTYHPGRQCIKTGEIVWLVFYDRKTAVEYGEEHRAATIALADADGQEKLSGEDWEPIVREVTT